MLIPTSSREIHLTNALKSRQHFFHQRHLENTDCYRLFHGTSEGEAGLTIDRYGSQLLIQSFHAGLDSKSLESISELYQQHFSDLKCAYYHDRTHKTKSSRQKLWGENNPIVHELGISLNCDLSFESQDPLLFLDLRAARRKIATIATGKSILNAFCYTGAIGLQAIKHGAKRLTQLDFSQFALAKAKINAQLNALESHPIDYIHEDFFVASRQFAKLPVGGRGKRKYNRYQAQSFDIIILDPPRFAKSPFGTVDLIRDYQSLLKPCLHALNSDGYILCTNNVARVKMEDWLDVVTACCIKNDRTIESIETIYPDEDFPSFDSRPPLKKLLIKFH